MLNQEKNKPDLDKLLLQLYAVDLKVNEAAKATTASFNKSSELFKTIFKPLQLHRSNFLLLLKVPGASSIDSSTVKDSVSEITTKLQFHDVVEQRLKHIRQTNNEIIQEVISTKKANKVNPDLNHICSVGAITAAQVDNLAEEYKSYCAKLDESLAIIKRYVDDWHAFSSSPTIEHDDDTANLIFRNNELAATLRKAFNVFENDLGYRKTFLENMTDILKALRDIPVVLKPTAKLPANHVWLRRLENLYTTQSEREVFKRTIFSVVQNPSQYRPASGRSDSGIELF